MGFNHVPLFFYILKSKKLFALHLVYFFCICVNKICVFDDKLKKYVAKLFVS